MSEWRECKLGDFAEIQTGPFGSQLHAADYVDVGIPSIMPTNIGNRLEVRTDSIACIKEEDAKRLERYLIKENDIVYSRRGNVEKCAFITSKQSGWLCGTGCLRVRFISTELFPKFCAYYLSTDEIKGWVSGNAVGTTMPNLNSSILKRVPLTLPPLPEQKAIAAVLSSLDDKIDLLHRQNQTLEAMAATLFRQWFVEEAQENWEDKSLLDVVELVGGGTPKTSVAEYWDGEIPWLSGGDIASSHKSFVINFAKTITQEGLDKSSAKLLPKFATVISARGTVGKYALLSEPMTYSQSNYGVLPKIEGCFFFTYLLINHAVSELRSSAYGSVFDTITTTTFQGIGITVPPHEAIQDFEKMVSVYFIKKLHVLTQIQTVEKLRDTLLPKLMSGEVRVAA
ncbi:MAG: restriction endonuclease subunit S [Gallionellaceae bacterium]